MGKSPQSREDLKQHLKEQLEFIRRSSQAYDDGYSEEAKRLATTIRVLVHDTKNSKSLLTQLDEKGRDFWDSSVPNVANNLAPYGGLVQTAAGLDGATYLPHLDDPLPSGAQPRVVDFDTWWNAEIIKTADGDVFSRRSLVLCVADQDGGAHVDPALDESYARLSRDRGMGWTHTGTQGTRTIRPGDRATVRQIAHEVLKTFDPSFEAHPREPEGTLFRIGHSELVIANAERKAVPVEIVVKQEPPRVRSRPAPMFRPTTVRHAEKPGRNSPCPCGSGESTSAATVDRLVGTFRAHHSAHTLLNC
jgi:hypothetical protein